jgi:hypothetical protein
MSDELGGRRLWGDSLGLLRAQSVFEASQQCRRAIASRTIVNRKQSTEHGGEETRVRRKDQVRDLVTRTLPAAGKPE